MTWVLVLIGVPIFFTVTQFWGRLLRQIVTGAGRFFVPARPRPEPPPPRGGSQDGGLGERWTTIEARDGRNQGDWR